MVKVNSQGQMVRIMIEIINMIKELKKVVTILQMASNILDTGKIVNIYKLIYVILKIDKFCIFNYFL